jgi:hypothetical protein
MSKLMKRLKLARRKHLLHPIKFIWRKFVIQPGTIMYMDPSDDECIARLVGANLKVHLDELRSKVNKELHETI